MKKKYTKLQKGHFYMNKKTGHPSMPYHQNIHRVKSIGFTENGDETHGKKSKLNYNINPKSKKDCYAKRKVEIYDSSVYKNHRKYSKYRVHKDDHPIIDDIIGRKKR